MQTLKALFTFEGTLDRRPYALGSVAVILLQYAFVLVAAAASGVPGQLTNPVFWIDPLRALVLTQEFVDSTDAPIIAFSGLALLLVIDWLLVAMAFRRLRQTGYGPQAAIMMIIPAVQLALFACFAVARPGAVAPTPATEGKPTDARTDYSIARDAILGMGFSVALILSAAAFSTLVLRIYGYALFIGTPFVVGLVTAVLVNRRGRLGLYRTFSIAMGSLFAGGLALIGFAFEGAICVVLAWPLVIAMAFIGAAIGREIAQASKSKAHTLQGIALLPFLMMFETLAPPRAEFESVESIDVAASPMAVWNSVIHMGAIPDAPAAPFGWGLAYPVAGVITGEGEGAIRRGIFSTGEAFERVTEWEPGRKLSFIVLSDPPMMQELSPYPAVQAPHTRGYFRTDDARFTITPLPDGRTRLQLATHHHLDIEPAVYWMPIAQWAVHANKRRVLSHFAHQAEASGS